MWTILGRHLAPISAVTKRVNNILRDILRGFAPHPPVQAGVSQNFKP